MKTTPPAQDRKTVHAPKADVRGTRGTKGLRVKSGVRAGKEGPPKFTS